MSEIDLDAIEDACNMMNEQLVGIKNDTYAKAIAKAIARDRSKAIIYDPFQDKAVLIEDMSPEFKIMLLSGD